MKAAPEVSCYEGDHVAYSAVSIIVIVLFCFGVPIALFAASYRACHGKNRTARDRAFVGLLTHSYQPRYFYFEAVDLIRKMVISSLLLVLWPDSRLQLFAGATLSSLFVVVVFAWQPYEQRFFNVVQGAASLQTTITFAAAMVYIDEDDSSPSVAFGYLLIVINCVCLLSLPWYAVILWQRARQLAEEMNRPPDPSRPTIWLTSNGLSSDRLKAEFVRIIVMRKLRRPLDPEDLSLIHI